MVSSNSSSSSQQPVNAAARSVKQHHHHQQQQAPASSSLIGDISTLRNRLQELDSTDINSPMNMNSRPRSQPSLDGGRREPPQSQQSNSNSNTSSEPDVVVQLRKDLKSMEAQKAELELTLMNQMSNLAYENQTTIDGLHARLAKSEKLVESLQQEAQIGTGQQQPSNSLQAQVVDRLRQSLDEERGMRKALEEERDARHQEMEQLKEHRDCAEQECTTLKEGLVKMQQHMDILHSSNVELTAQVKRFNGENDQASKVIESLQSQVTNQQAKLADVERSHQGQMSEIKASYQQRYNQLEKQLLSQTPDKNQAGVGHLHRKIAELENENDDLAHQVMDLHEKLESEQSMNSALEQSLEEQTNNSAKLWESLAESQQRCVVLEKELLEQPQSNDNTNSQDNNEDVENLQSENEMLSNQIATIHEQCVSEQEKCAKLVASLDSERNTNSKLRLSLRQHQQRYEELNRNLHRNQTGIGLINGNGNNAKIGSLEKEKKALEDQLSKERSRTAELEASLAKRQNAIQEQLQNTAGRRQSDVAALEGAQLELQSVMNSYQSDMANLERKVQQSEQQLAERNRQNQRLEVEINEERRIRKSLMAQLTQMKLASKSSSGDEDNGNSAELEAELQRVQQENAKLIDELKHRANLADQVDPAELEFLRKQNRMLGERANGLHGEQMKEMEDLRERNMQLMAELNEISATKTESTTSQRNNPGSLLQKEQKAELDQLRQQNAALKDELKALKLQQQQSASPGRSEPPQSPSRRQGQPPSPRRSFKCRSASPAPRERPISNTSQSEAASSGMLTPPLSPPLMRKKPGSPSPVRGLVENFERRISRTNSSSSLGSVAQAAQSQMAEQHSTSNANQAQSATASELDDIRRELKEEKASFQALQEKYAKECELVQTLRDELSKMEQSESKRDRLERTLQEREKEISSLRAKMNELERLALEANDMRISVDKERSLVQDLQGQLEAERERATALQSELSRMAEAEKTAMGVLQEKLDAEAENVSMLRNELAKLEESEGKCNKLEEKSKSSELDLQRLRSKVSNLEMMLSNAQSQASDEEELERMKVELMQADAARQGFEKKLFDERVEMQNLHNEMLSAEARLEESQAELQKLKEEKMTSFSLIAELEQRKREDETLIERLQAELGAARMGLEHSLDELERHKSSSSESSQKDQAGVEQDKAEIQRLRSELEVAKQALDINVEEMEKLQRCVKEADASRMIAVRQSMSSQNDGQQHMDKLMVELATARTNNQSQAEEVERLREQVAALQQELVEAMNNVEELQKTIFSIETAHDSQLQDAQISGKRTTKSIGKEVNTLKVELTKNQISRADMQMEYMSKIHDLESKIDAMQAEAEDELQHKVKELNRSQMTLTSKENEIRLLKKERDQLCNSMKNVSSTRKDEMEELQEEVLKLTAKTTSQSREIQSLKMQVEDHDYRKSEFEKLEERIEELEEDLRRASTQSSSGASHSNAAIMKAENKMLRESIRELGVERRSLQEKLEAHLAEKATSKSTQVLRERNAALKKEVEKLTKRLKKMEHSMTRFTI